jgi:hypothetical protein
MNHQAFKELVDKVQHVILGNMSFWQNHQNQGYGACEYVNSS